MVQQQQQQERYSSTPHRAVSQDLMMFTTDDRLSSAQQTSSYSECHWLLSCCGGSAAIGVWDNFFWGGLVIFARKFFDSAQKTAMLTYKITLPDSPHPVIISKKRISGTLSR